MNSFPSLSSSLSLLITIWKLYLKGSWLPRRTSSQHSTGLDILTILSPQYLTLHMVSKIKYQTLAEIASFDTALYCITFHPCLLL